LCKTLNNALALQPAWSGFGVPGRRCVEMIRNLAEGLKIAADVLVQRYKLAA